jgi:hypothetical protein
MTTEIDKLVANVSTADAHADDISVYKEPLNINPYEFMDNAYYGIKGFRDGTYLTPHLREMFYTSRRQTSVYKNFTKPILDAMVNPVFADRIPRRVDKNSLYSYFVEDTDNTKLSLDDAISDAMHICVRHGQVFVVMDNFAQSDMPETIMEARKSRVFPYVMIKTALDVDSSELDRWGNLISITFIDQKITDGKKTTQLYRTWNAQSSQLMIKAYGKYKPYAPPVVHGLGVIPVITTYLSNRLDKTTLIIDPPHYDIARMNLGIYNMGSELRDLNRAQSFSTLVIQSDRAGNITAGTRNVIYVPASPDIRFAPSFISPNPSISVGLMVYEEKMITELYKRAEQNGVTAVKSEASGVSEAFRFFGHESVLRKISSKAATLDAAIFNIFSLYTGETIDYEADYPTDFAPGNIQVEVDTLEKYLKQKLPPKATSLAKQKWTRLILSDQDPDKLDDAMQEIEDESKLEEISVEPIIVGETGMTGETGMVNE